MTAKEAIRRIKDHFRVHDDGRPTPYLDEAVKMAINALERQIPKKPSEVNESEYDRFYCVDFMCDTCNTAVIGQPYRPKHCKHCGQALDWSK